MTRTGLALFKRGGGGILSLMESNTLIFVEYNKNVCSHTWDISCGCVDITIYFNALQSLIS